jgi:predicted TIM-barrel fold metal-dependent hydrolase
MRMSDSPNRDAWRAQVVEAPLEADLPIIDPHHHLWPMPMTPQMEAYGAEALVSDKAGCGHNIVATVFVEANARYRTDGPASLRPVGETAYADQVGRDCDRRGGRAAGACAGIVAHADMMLGEAVEDVLIAHREASPDRLRGIRHLVAYDPDFPGIMPGSRPGVLSEPAFRAAFGRLSAHGLSYDAWVMHPQLGELATLAGAFPETLIVLDHVGAPMGTGRYADGGGDGFEEWRRGMVEVAAHQNVVLKLGGLNMSLTGLGALRDAPKPWDSLHMAQAQSRHLLTAIDIFGPGRCMFESNFPVDRVSTGACALWNGFKRVAQGFSEGEKADLFSGVAARTYRLDLQKLLAASAA